MENRRLTRSLSDKKIFGVCGGLAVLILVYGAGLLVYLIAALIMPVGD